ncbi:MAG TPA: biotin-independent malonate decarboxylase subunit gamma [Casimicrobiaceae bacterium]
MPAAPPAPARARAVDWQSVADRLFPQGHAIAEEGDLLDGSGRCGDVLFAVTGTTRHVDVGVEIALAMAQSVLRTVREHPGRPILFLMDTEGQRLRRRDEMLGLNRYMAHIGKCVEVARRHGHRIVGLVYGEALSGGFIASAMNADVCGALPDAQIYVMGLPAMARVTRIAEERLRELSRTSPVFAPGAINYVAMGGVDALWEGDLAACLMDALARADSVDRRAEVGAARGGRPFAASVARRVATDA